MFKYVKHLCMSCVDCAMKKFELSPIHFKLRKLENQPVSVPVHPNRLKAYFEQRDRPIEAPTEHSSRQDEPHLRDDDIPSESLATDPVDPSAGFFDLNAEP